ncbi:MAG: PAS domain S-box protein [Promethearchaeota archaeon]
MKGEISSYGLLNPSEEMYKNIIDNLKDLITILDLEGNFLYFSPQIYDISGFKQEELLGKSGFQIMHPDDVIHASNVLMEAIKQKEKIYFEFRTLHKDGHYIDVAASGRIVEMEGEERILAIIRDITEQKRIERKQKESEKQYRYLIENTLKGVWVIDENAKTTLVNSSMAKILGYKVEEMIGKNLFDFISSEDREFTKNTLERSKKGIKEEIEKKFIHKDGKEIITRLVSSPMFSENNDYKGAIAFVSDITERKKTEEKLRESEEKFRTITEQSLMGILILQDGVVKYANEKLAEMGGYSIEEMKSWTTVELAELIHPEDREFVMEQLRKKQIGDPDVVNQYMYRIIRKEGEVGWREIFSKTINYNGALADLVIIIDVTDRRNAELALKESEEKFRSLTEESQLAITILQDDTVKYANQKSEDLYGYSLDEMKSWEPKEYKKIIAPESIEFVMEQARKKQAGDPDVTIHYPIHCVKKSGELIWVDNISKTIMYEGRPANFITQIDITERIKAQEELVKLNQIKSELLRRTSHELKTPLVSIKGYADLLLSVHKENLNDYVLSSIVEIKQGCERLENLIQDILNTAELESGTIQLKKVEEDLSFFIKLSIRELRGLARLRNQTINLKIKDQLITSFEPEQIHRVISNLINNAIKYTPPDGLIEIDSEIKEGNIIVLIKDSGIGITKEEKERLFTQFGKIERYGQGLDIISDGSGLGLFISKKIIELHGGKIWVESQGRNKGSTFYISLPIIQESIE